MSKSLALSVVTAVLMLTACTDMPGDSCIARGGQRAYTGTWSYELDLLDVAPATGKIADSMLVKDYDPSCVYDQEEFLLTMRGCELWIQLEPSQNFTDDTTDAVPGDVETAQSCTVMLPEGAALISVGPGKLTFSGTTPTLTVDTAIGSLNGAPASGTLHLVFLGD